MRSTLARTPAKNPEAERSRTITPAFGAPVGLDLVIELAHDLRSPLSSILILAESLKTGQSGPVSEAQRRQLNLIHSAALTLCSTASDVMELARSGERLIDKEPAPFSVTEILTAVNQMVAPIAMEKSLALRSVPEAYDRRTGRERALARVLLNLATNALKYTERGFVEVSAHDVAGEPDLVEFAVTDSGRGIDAAEMRVLFEPWREREAQGGHQFSSAGLGLAICRKLVKAMGSTLQVSTKLGRGTRFSFVVNAPPSRSWTAA